MFLNWKNQYCYKSKEIYRYRAVSVTLPMAFFKQLEQNILKCVETEKISNSQNNLDKEVWSWRNHVLWLQTILQSYNNENSTIPAQTSDT